MKKIFISIVTTILLFISAKSQIIYVNKYVRLNAGFLQVDTCLCGSWWTMATRVYVDNKPALGGGGINIYNTDSSLASDRLVDMNGHNLTFNNGSSFLVATTALPGSNSTSQLQASNQTNLGNGTTILADAYDTYAQFSFSTAFNDGETASSILGQAQSGSSTISYTATTHTFNGAIVQPFSTLNFGATTTWDMGTGDNKVLTLSGDANLIFSNATNGNEGTLIVIQDGIGGHELTVPDEIISINKNPGDTTVLGFTYDGSTYYWATSSLVAGWDSASYILNQATHRQIAKAKIDSIDVSYLRIRTDTSENYPLTTEGSAAYKYPLVVESIDTNATNTFNNPPVYTAYIKKVLRFPSNVRSQYHIGLHGGIKYEVTDSANIYSTGGDFGASIQAENEYNELSSSGEVRIQGGTIAADVVPAIYGGHIVRTFTTGVHFRGYWGGFNTYFNNGGVNRDTVDHWIAYLAPSTQAMKHYETWTGLYVTPPGSSVATNAWNIYAPQSNGRSLFGGQVGIGSTGFGTFIAPSFNASALLTLSSTTQGFLPPVMNTTQMNAISAPATGLIVWNSDSLSLCKYNGSVWLKAEGSGTSSQWTTTGSNIYYNTGAVGIGNTGPGASSILELTSTTKGFLGPRMNTTQQNGISSPATGLLIFNTDTAAFRFYNGSVWTTMASGSGLSSVKTIDGANIVGSGNYITDYTMESMAALGDTTKGFIVGKNNMDGPISAAAMTDGSARMLPIYIPQACTVYGFRWYMITAGNYTADNYNGAGLYSYSAGTLTFLGSSTNDGNIWKQAANTWGNKDFSSPITISTPGLYFLFVIYNNSAQTTAPAPAASSTLANTAVASYFYTNSAKLVGSLNVGAALPSPTQAMSGVAAAAGPIWFFTLY